MAMSAKAAAAAAEVDALLDQVRQRLPDEFAALSAAGLGGAAGGSDEEGSQHDLTASLEADTDVLLADSPTQEQQPELASFGDGSSPAPSSPEGLFSDADTGDEDNTDEEVYDEGEREGEGEGEGERDESAAHTYAELVREEEAPERRRRRRRRARRRATLGRRRASSSRLAQLAIPSERSSSTLFKRIALAEDAVAQPDRHAAAAQTQKRERRIHALESMAAEYAAIAAQLSSDDRAAVISQMEAMYAEVLRDGGQLRTAPSSPAVAKNGSSMEQPPSTSNQSSTMRVNSRKSIATSGDPWAEVRKSAAAMEHSVRQYAGSSERRPKTVPPAGLPRSIEEAELLRSVQQVLGESAAMSSELSRSSVSDIVHSNMGGASLVAGSTDARRRWSDLSTSRAVRRPPRTLVRWLETSWHHHSSATNSHGFELRTDENSDDSENELDSDGDCSDDAASFVRFVRRHARDLGSFSASDLWERESAAEGVKSVRSSLSSMALPASGLSRAEVNTIGRNYLDHLHKNGPKERAVRKAQKQATALIAKGRYVEAIRLIDEGLVASQERKQINEVRALTKLCIQGRLLLVAELNSVGRATEAIRICTAGLRLLPNDPELQGALDSTVPQVLAAEEFLDAATTSLAMKKLEDAKEAMLQAVQLDVASTRLPPLLEEGAKMANEQGDEETAALLRREAAALGAFDRRMQAAWVQAERAEHARTSFEQVSQGHHEQGLAGSSHVRRSNVASASARPGISTADSDKILQSTLTSQRATEQKRSRSSRHLFRHLESSEEPLPFPVEEDELLSPWVSGE